MPYEFFFDLEAVKRDTKARLPKDPIVLFTQIAVDLNLIAPGERLDPLVLALCERAVRVAAVIADNHRVLNQPERTVGDVIRAYLYSCSGLPVEETADL